MKHTIARSSQEVHDQLVPFWIKSRIPIKSKHHIVRKICDLFNEQISLMKHRTRSKIKDQKNQENYSKKLDKMFDISHGNADQMITIEEDKEFLNLQRASRTGSFGCVDKKLATVEKRSAERRERFNKRVKVEFDRKSIKTAMEEVDNSRHIEEVDNHVNSSSSSEDLSDDFLSTSYNHCRKHIIS